MKRAASAALAIAAILAGCLQRDLGAPEIITIRSAGPIEPGTFSVNLSGAGGWSVYRLLPNASAWKNGDGGSELYVGSNFASEGDHLALVFIESGGSLQAGFLYPSANWGLSYQSPEPSKVGFVVAYAATRNASAVGGTFVVNGHSAVQRPLGSLARGQDAFVASYIETGETVEFEGFEVSDNRPFVEGAGRGPGELQLGWDIVSRASGISAVNAIFGTTSARAAKLSATIEVSGDRESDQIAVMGEATARDIGEGDAISGQIALETMSPDAQSMARAFALFIPWNIEESNLTLERDFRMLGGPSLGLMRAEHAGDGGQVLQSLESSQ